MKTSNILAATALSLLAVAGAHAENYEGVLQHTGILTRADVNAQAIVAARSVNPYATGATAARIAPVMNASVDRSTVRAEAYAKAHAPNQNVRVESFAGSKLPSQYINGTLKIRSDRQASLGSVVTQ